MHGNMILVLKMISMLKKSRKITKTIHIRPRLPWDRVVIAIPNTRKFENPVTQNRKCSCAKVIQS